MSERPEIPRNEYEKPLPKGGDLPPLPLLPDREWLEGKIVNVEYRYSMFNGKIQYVTKQAPDPETGEEVEVAVLDKDGNKIARKEFNIKIELFDYKLPNGDPRCCWLTVGASMGDRAHLPTLLFNVIGPDFEPESPKAVIDALKGEVVRLQLANKPNKKDPTKPPYQKVIYDAVKRRDLRDNIPSVQPISESEMPEEEFIPQDEIQWDE